MNHYGVLEMTNTLVAQQGWTLQRCRRRCDGPARYMVLDQIGRQMLTDSSHKTRRLGFTVAEVLIWLGKSEDTAVSEPAENLFKQLITLVEYE